MQSDPNAPEPAWQAAPPGAAQDTELLRKAAVRAHIAALARAAPVNVPPTPIDNALSIAATNVCATYGIAGPEREIAITGLCNALAAEWHGDPFLSVQNERVVSALSQLGAIDPKSILPWSIESYSFSIKSCLEATPAIGPTPHRHLFEQAQAREQKLEQERLKAETKRLEMEEKARLLEDKKREAEERERMALIHSKWIAACQARKARITEAKNIWRAAVSNRDTELAILDAKVRDAREVARVAESEPVPNLDEFKHDAMLEAFAAEEAKHASKHASERYLKHASDAQPEQEACFEGNSMTFFTLDESAEVTKEQVEVITKHASDGIAWEPAPSPTNENP